MYKFIRQITPLLLLLASLAMSANNSYRFIHITGNDGLSHQQVEHLMQDHKGEIWIGTRNGLQRYNGYEIISTEFERIPNDVKDVTPEQREKIEKLLDKLEEDEDVQNVFHNMRELDDEGEE